MTHQPSSLITSDRVTHVYTSHRISAPIYSSAHAHTPPLLCLLRWPGSGATLPMCLTVPDVPTNGDRLHSPPYRATRGRTREPRIAAGEAAATTHGRQAASSAHQGRADAPTRPRFIVYSAFSHQNLITSYPLNYTKNCILNYSQSLSLSFAASAGVGK